MRKDYHLDDFRPHADLTAEEMRALQANAARYSENDMRALREQIATLRAELEQAKKARDTWFNVANERGVTIDRLNEELEEAIGDAADFITRAA